MEIFNYLVTHGHINIFFQPSTYNISYKYEPNGYLCILFVKDQVKDQNK